ncbi:hypothetical protein GCM10009827_074350 [Dactylosporangium maewongense]|uniref:Uncharacterized protein n=1 Tax=Dactylosporangium maewongense TaxID=634393 RepID=A0ABP4MFV6_9ACTN
MPLLGLDIIASLKNLPRPTEALQQHVQAAVGDECGPRLRRSGAGQRVIPPPGGGLLRGHSVMRAA